MGSSMALGSSCRALKGMGWVWSFLQYVAIDLLFPVQMKAEGMSQLYASQTSNVDASMDDYDDEEDDEDDMEQVME
jgi:hypothetical protein